MVLCGLSLAAFGQTGDVNLVANGSFEDSSGASVTGWGGVATSLRDSTVKRSGSYSIKRSGPLGGVYFSPSPASPTLLPDTTYVMRFWAKGQGVAGAKNVGVNIRHCQITPTPAPNPTYGQTINSWTYLSYTGDWCLSETYFTVPGDYLTGRFDVYWNLNSGDTAWIDDVSINEAGVYGAPSELLLLSHPWQAYRDGKSIVVLEARITDKAGNPCLNDTHSITFSLSGPGQLVGQNPAPVRDGVAYIHYVAGNAMTTGDATVTAATTGFSNATVVIELVPRTNASVEPTLPYGLFEDGNLIWSGTAFATMATDMKTRSANMDWVMITNGGVARTTGLLDTADTLGVKVAMSPTQDLSASWFNHPSVTLDLPTALSIAGPIVDAWSGKPAFRHYYVIDEPAIPQDMLKTSLMLQVFEELDPTRGAFSVIANGADSPAMFDYTLPSFLVLDPYPVRNGTTLGSWVRDFVNDIRLQSRSLPAGGQMWTILQAHGRETPTQPSDLLRPDPVEVRAQHWLALGEGSKGIFWFIYHTQQWWLGLQDNPDLWDEITDQAERLSAIRGIVPKLQKIEDRFSVTGTGPNPYVSTLMDPNDRTVYVVVQNGDCANPRTLTVSASRPGTYSSLEDVETSTVYPLGSAIPLDEGDGKFLRMLPSNLVANPGMETDADTDGYADGWVKRTEAPRTTAEKHFETASMTVSGNVNNYSYQNLNLLANKTYKMSVWIKTQGVVGSGVRMRHTGVMVETAWVAGTTPWTKYEVTFNTSGAASGRLDLQYLFTGGQAWFDDVRLEEIN